MDGQGLPRVHIQQFYFVKTMSQADSSMKSDEEQISGKVFAKKDRVNRIKKGLQDEKKEILLNMEKDIQEFMNKSKLSLKAERIKNNLDRIDETYDCLKVFHCACNNLMSVFFPLLEDQDFISLQSQAQINDKIRELKIGIKKHLKILQEKCLMNGKQLRPLEDTVKIQGEGKRSAKNSKTASESNEIFTRWLVKNFKNPYPTTADKEILSNQSGLSVSQVNNWFINTRERVIKKYLRPDFQREKKEEHDSKSNEDVEDLLQ